MKLLFELTEKQNICSILPALDVPSCEIKEKREKELVLPQASETEISRYYTSLAKKTHGVNDGFYPLGSCTMKYNPKINEDMAKLDGFAKVHPLASEESTQGCIEVISKAEEYLSEILGMDAVSFQPAAGAHGEFTGLLLIKAYHESKGDKNRTKIIVPDSAHGTNPASATMAGYEIVSIASAPDGCVDIDALKAVVGDDTAGLMLTNPNTVGLFDKNILEITKIVHDAGGLNYYDGANLNAVMGVVRPGDMGFDVTHVNLHKTFSTPHGGGGPGSGPVGCKEFLTKFLPCPYIHAGKVICPENSIGTVKRFNGNFAVVVKALTYMMTLGAKGIREAAENAVLNANYMKVRLADTYDMAFDNICMHEFVISLEKFKHDCGVSALDIAKALLDRGIHPPTMYFPLIVHEALMIEPTETESKETLDEAIDALIDIYKNAAANPEDMHNYPKNQPITRLDEVKAARMPILKHEN